MHVDISNTVLKEAGLDIQNHPHLQLRTCMQPLPDSQNTLVYSYARYQSRRCVEYTRYDYNSFSYIHMYIHNHIVSNDAEHFRITEFILSCMHVSSLSYLPWCSLLLTTSFSNPSSCLLPGGCQIITGLDN